MTILAPWGPLGGLLEASCAVLGGLVRRLEAILGVLERPFGDWRRSWAILGASWGPLGPSWIDLAPRHPHLWSGPQGLKTGPGGGFEKVCWPGGRGPSSPLYDILRYGRNQPRGGGRRYKLNSLRKSPTGVNICGIDSRQGSQPPRSPFPESTGPLESHHRIDPPSSLVPLSFSSQGNNPRQTPLRCC